MAKVVDNRKGPPKPISEPVPEKPKGAGRPPGAKNVNKKGKAFMAYLAKTLNSIFSWMGVEVLDAEEKQILEDGMDIREDTLLSDMLNSPLFVVIMAVMMVVPRLLKKLTGKKTPKPTEPVKNETPQR